LQWKNPIAPSPIAIRGEDNTLQGKKPFVQPTEMTLEEMKEVINDFKNAISVGFDGVQLHNPNRYLLDQFTRSYTFMSEMIITDEVLIID
jgi:N-ethylmaleimide reductase